MGPNEIEPISKPKGKMENKPPATISDSPNRNFNRGNTEPISTMETPNKRIPAKTEIKAIVLLFIN